MCSSGEYFVTFGPSFQQKKDYFKIGAQTKKFHLAKIFTPECVCRMLMIIVLPAFSTSRRNGQNASLEVNWHIYVERGIIGPLKIAAVNDQAGRVSADI